MTLTLILTPRNIYEKYESAITYPSKALANVKLFADKQTDRKTDRPAKKLYAPDLSMRVLRMATLSISFDDENSV